MPNDESKEMIHGSCLCGAVTFKVRQFVGPFELCHCSRCRKASGSAFVAAIGLEAADFFWLDGESEVRRFELPLLDRPPAYSRAFCQRCGGPVPDPPTSGFFEIPAGLLDDDPGLEPDKHIFVEMRAPWWRIEDNLPRYTAAEIAVYRHRHGPLSD